VKDLDKRASRVAANGLVAASGPAIIELNCETDFVAKNAQFQALAENVAKVVEAARPSDAAAALDLELPDGTTVRSAIEGLSAVIGEKLELRRIAVLAGEGAIATYLHRKDPALPPQVGVLVSYVGGDEATARMVGMQVAAMRPRYLTRDEVPADIVETERRIAEQGAIEEGKPEAAVPKIIEGKVNAFYKGVVLLEQDWVRDSKLSVERAAADAGLTVTGFVRFEVGGG
jgi:elongation factor Ts